MYCSVFKSCLHFLKTFFLCFSSDYKDTNFTLNVNDPQLSDAEAGTGVISAVWQLILAMVFKSIITIFTFGIKVRYTLQGGISQLLSLP